MTQASGSLFGADYSLPGGLTGAMERKSLGDQVDYLQGDNPDQRERELAKARQHDVFAVVVEAGPIDLEQADLFKQPFTGLRGQQGGGQEIYQNRMAIAIEFHGMIAIEITEKQHGRHGSLTPSWCRSGSSATDGLLSSNICTTGWGSRGESAAEWGWYKISINIYMVSLGQLRIRLPLVGLSPAPLSKIETCEAQKWEFIDMQRRRT